MPFTEFCCRSGGSNLNGGGLASGAEPGTSAVYTSTNGNWNGTAVFTPTDGSTPASTVNVGDFASVYIDGATVGVYVARVTAVAAGANGAITLSTTAKSGTPPSSSATTRSIKVGGAWKGPNGAENFPVNFVATAMTNVVGNPPRVNLKNDATYSITASLAHSLVGPVVWQGYTTTFGDGGKAVIDGGTTGASYVLWNPSGSGAAYHDLIDLIFQNNGATGIADACLAGSDFRSKFINCVAHDIRGQGFVATCISCEAYNCNQSNTASLGAFRGQNASIGFFLNCIAHDNPGNNVNGFYLQSATCVGCISDSNGLHGFYSNGLTSQVLIGCEAYNNGGDGFRHITQTIELIIINCNFFKNTGWGINISTGIAMGYVDHCGFGSGSVGNTLGSINATNMALQQLNNYISATLPWVDAPNGDFRINLTAAKGTGRGIFTETQASYAGTIGYPDIGAAQHQDAGGGGAGGVSRGRALTGM